MGNEKKEGSSFFVCRNSFLNVLSLGHDRMTTINKTRFDPGPNIHKNSGNKNASFSNESRQSVHDFVKEKGDSCGEYYATRLIRHITKHELRDEEKDAVDLPSDFTKRNIYEQHGRGWAPKANNKGRYPKLQDFPKRKKDDVLWEDDMDTDEIVSWWSFRHIWREDLPTIRIRAPCNDTCDECTILRTAFRYRERRQQTSENSDESDDSDDDKLEDERGNDNEQHAEFKEGEDEVSNLAKSLLTSDCIHQEAVLDAAGFHVTQ
jgi:hypothetical protein